MTTTPALRYPHAAILLGTQHTRAWDLASSGTLLLGPLGPVLTADLATRLATAVDVTPTGRAVCSEAAVVPGVDRRGRAVIVRVSRDDAATERYEQVAAALGRAAAGHVVRAPRLLHKATTIDGWVCCTWERLDTHTTTAEDVGWGLTRLEAVRAPDSPVPFDPVPSTGRQPAFDDVLTRALWEQAADRWQTWLRTRPAFGWTHGDWTIPGDNMSVHDGRLTVWDLGDSGWGPLGWDVASLWFNARFARTGPDVADAAVAAYEAHGGKVDAARARDILEPAVAAMSALACARRALHRPELTAEARRRMRSALHDRVADYAAGDETAARWTPIGAIGRDGRPAG